MVEPVRMQKIALRDRLLTTRRRLSLAEAAEQSASIAAHLLAAPEVRRAATVAAYVSTPSEPGTGLLLDELQAQGKRILLPVVLPDLDLDWAPYTGSRALVPARRGLLEPVAARLGPEAIATADVVLCPGLAVDSSGMRLGQGGGCYDRALARVPRGAFVCAVLYDGEVVDALPADEHDRPVSAAVTPAGVIRFTPRLPWARG